MKAQLLDREEISVNKLNRWYREYSVLVTVGVTNFEEEALYFIENTTTDKKKQVWTDIFALIVFAGVIQLHV